MRLRLKGPKLLPLFLVFSARAFAQDTASITGSITGTVTDPSGAPVACSFPGILEQLWSNLRVALNL